MSLTTPVGQPTFFAVPVAGGELTVARYGAGERLVLGIHGITASALSLAPVARHLGAAHTLLAPDLRGRAGSAELPGPFGMAAHAADCASVIEHAGGGSAVVVGESMGGFVAVMLAAARPELVRRLVLVDGGIPLPVPVVEDPDGLIDTVLGPSVARLRMTFASRGDYQAFWRQHPAFSNDWNEDLEAYLDYDLTGVEPQLRSRVSEAAIRADGADTLLGADQLSAALRSLRCPVTLLRAPRGLLDQPEPLIPDSLADTWRRDLPQLSVRLVPDTNHYTLMFADRGAREIAAAIDAADGAP